MHSLIKCSLIIASLFVSSNAEVEKRDNITLKAPIIATPSEDWDGVDGLWSTFEIRLGTPQTTYRVLPATSWQETWVIYGIAAGVCNTTAGVPADCQDARGGVFNSAASSTWVPGPQDYLQLNTELGYQGVGQYGFDTLGLGFTSTSGPTLPHQIIAEIVTDYWYIGILGLGFQPTNFTGYGNAQASFSDTLYSNGSISSMSWSYTAGAYYRLKGVFGSLIYGGLDRSRFEENDVVFDMTSDNLRDIVVTLRGISSSTGSGNTTLMSYAEFAFIDSSIPDLWLPTTVCEEFEKAFNITLDAATGLYLLDSSQHQALLSLNPTITLTLANQKTGGPTVDLTLPYAAFDHNISAPLLVNETSYYFPIRRTDDDGLYALGRTFLQEAYVTAHYNSRTFNVSQSVFSDNYDQEIVALPATLPTYTTTSGSTTTSTSSKKKKGLAAGVIAGIVIGALAFLAIVALLAFCILRRRRRQRQRQQEINKKHENAVEIDSGKRVDPKENSIHSQQASALTSEVEGRERIEKWGVPVMVPQELEAEAIGVSGSSGGGIENGQKTVENERLAPLREYSHINAPAKTPMAELGVEERGLGFGTGQDVDEHVVSPTSATLLKNNSRSWGASTMSAINTGPVSTAMSGSPQSPTISEATWSARESQDLPRRKGSRVEEHLDGGKG